MNVPEPRTEAGRRTVTDHWLLTDLRDDVLAIERETDGELQRLRDAVVRYQVAVGRAPRNYSEAEAVAAFDELQDAIKAADARLLDDR